MAEKPNRRSIITRIVILTAVALVAIGVVLLVMAFVLKGQTGFEGKTLWDWMSLLIVPLVVGVGVFLLDTLEKRRQEEIDTRRAETDRQLALDRTQEDRLQAYLDRMTELLLEKGLRTSSEDSEIRNVARTRTVTVLRGLDSKRRNFLLSFLHASELLRGADSILRRAYLSSADLSRTYLRRVNLSGARLRGANLSNADLSGANLSGTHLSKANLREANLSGANLSGADLSNAVLSGADLNGATYDDATEWPDGFDPIKTGAKKVEPKPQNEVNAEESKPA